MKNKNNTGNKGTDSLKYKLTHLWGVMERSGKNEFANKEEFLKWAEESGYKPWKSLALIDEDSGYSSDNCFWKMDRKKSGTIQNINEDDTSRNVCRIIRKCVNDLEDSKMQIMTTKQLLNDLLDSDKISSRVVLKDAVKDVDKALLSLRSSLGLIDKLEIMFDNDSH